MAVMVVVKWPRTLIANASVDVNYRGDSAAESINANAPARPVLMHTTAF